MALNPLIVHFITEIVVDLLKWDWVLLIPNTNQEEDSLLAESLFQKNVSMIRFTSISRDMLHNMIRDHGNIHVILFSQNEIPTTEFLASCRIKWIFLLSDDIASEEFLTKTFEMVPKLYSLYVQSLKNGTFLLKTPVINSNHMQTVNTWTANEGFQTRSSFNSCPAGPLRPLTITMEKHFPFYQLPNGSRSAQGSDIKLLDSLAGALQFKYNIIRSSDGSWGGRNGTEFTGMIGMLVKHEADAALSGMTITYERYTGVRFSIPYAFDRVTFVTRKPTKKAKTWAIFWPYTMQVWIAIGLSLLAVSILMTILRNALKSSKRRKARFTDTTMFIFQALLTQGNYNANELRCRVLMCFWWAFCITMVAGYNGSLMSFMAHPGFNPSLDTVPQLVAAIKNKNFAVGTIKNSADYVIFVDSSEEELRIILASMESDPRNLVRHDVDGLRECLRREYAYIGGELTVRADIWDTKLFLFGKDSFLQYGYAIAFNPDYDHVDLFDKKIRQLQEAGIIRKWTDDIIERHQMSKGEARSDQDGEMHVLGIDDVQGAFSVLCIGLSLACVSCFAEYHIYLRKNKAKKKIRKKR